jgi:hypothetical protein
LAQAAARSFRPLSSPLQEFEAQYLQKKTAYDNVVATFEARTAALEAEVTGLKVREAGDSTALSGQAALGGSLRK